MHYGWCGAVCLPAGSNGGGRGADNNAVCFSYLPVAGLGEMLSLLHREGEAYTLMETELQSLELCGLPEDISPLSTS